MEMRKGRGDLQAGETKILLEALDFSHAKGSSSAKTQGSREGVRNGQREKRTESETFKGER